MKFKVENNPIAILGIAENWYIKNWAVKEKNNRLSVISPKGERMPITKPHFFARLYNLFEQPTAAEIKKFNFADKAKMEIAANANPEFIRQLFLDEKWKK